MTSYEDEGFGNILNQGSIGGIDNQVNFGSTGLVSTSGRELESFPGTAGEKK